MVQFIIGLVISVLALWLAFKGVDWRAFWEALIQGSVLGVVFAAVVLLSAIPLRGIRWCIFMKPVKEVPVRLTTEATVVGYFGNNAFPFRLGELLRTYFVARQAPAPMTQVFGTVIVERVVDFLSVLMVLIILPFVSAVPEPLRQPMLWVIVLCLITAVVTIWLARRKNGIPFVRGRVKTILDNLHLGFTSLRQGGHYPTLILTSLGIWLLYLIYIHLAQRAMGLGLSLADSYLVLVTTTLVIMVPAAPGYVGTFHAAVVLAFVNILSVDLSQAQATAVVLHLVGYIPYTIIGAILYFRSHLHFREVRAQRVEPRAGANR
ncbi:MAG: lysylphosphatidylglycerol synthase transmembrane domain-containing protein [Candidatus Neomarinimicrobiota bacterium]